jgi:DNA-binding XRE family transcriptional regulator
MSRPMSAGPYCDREAAAANRAPAPSTAHFAVSIGRVARRIRKLRGLTLAIVAQRAGISPSLLSRLETGDVSASLETLIALADALGVRPALLLQEVGGGESDLRQVAGFRGTAFSGGIVDEHTARVHTATGKLRGS